MPAECFAAGERPCAIVAGCRLRGVLAEAVDAFHAVLDRYTLADVAANPRELARLLHLPRASGPVDVERSTTRTP